MPSSQTETFDMLFFSLTVGIAILWLLSHKLGNRNRIVTFFLALIIMAVVGLAGAVSYAGLEFTQQAAGALILFGILILAMLLAFVLTAWRCRKRYSNLRFMLYLAVWTVAACLGITILFYSIVFIVAWAHISISTALLMVSVIGLVLSVFLYVIIFPFMILALRSSFFRERFFACLRLKPLPVASGDENSRPDEISVT